MAPKTRSSTKGAPHDFTFVHGSDSEPDTTHKHVKRQKTGHTVRKFTMSEDASQMNVDRSFTQLVGSSSSNQAGKIKGATAGDAATKNNKNAHLKGRRRFKADLADLKEECKDTNGVEVQGLRALRLTSDDDEDSIQFEIVDAGLKHILTVNLLISDTSDYPKDHKFYSSSADADVAIHFSQIMDSVANAPSRTIRETVERLLLALSKAADTGGIGSQSQIESQEIEMEDGDTSGDDYDAFDEYDDYASGASSKGTLDLSRLQDDFIDVVATGYRPGLIRFGLDDVTISVSLPVITLADSIPPQALMAWDRRLLSRTQHLSLLISGLRGVYPPINADGTYGYAAQRVGTSLAFKVGLTKRYKPGKEHAQEACRTYGLIVPDAEDELMAQAEKMQEAFDVEAEEIVPPPIEVEDDEDDGRFDRFSLSSSLESLLDQALLKVIQLRRTFKLGWAGAEALYSEVEKSQKKAELIYSEKKPEILAADKAEVNLARSYSLPHDPLRGLGRDSEINLPLTAFCYLVRRLTLCSRYCIVCHNPINTDFLALKPYVCDSKLCAYQYYSLNRGPSLEYEIRNNPETVDLLVSIAYVAAAERVIDEPLPIGMGLRVPIPNAKNNVMPVPQSPFNPIAPQPTLPEVGKTINPGPDGLCDFDDLSIWQMRASIMELIDSLPSVEDMKKTLERKAKPGKSKPKLKDTDPSVSSAAWSILRWCVASCTAHLEELTSTEERVRNLDPSWRQFRFSVGAPDAEAKFKSAVTDAQKTDKNAKKYPSLYAFHGSALKNWHSIIRHGLWFKNIVNGRAYGDGVYLAKDGSVSMGHYASGGAAVWRNSKLRPMNCVALAELVNLPHKFVSSNPYFVVNNTHWIMCRYLLVKGQDTVNSDEPTPPTKPNKTKIPLVNLDPAHPLTLAGASGSKKIEIPQPSYSLEILISARRTEFFEEDHDEDDLAIFEMKHTNASQSHSQHEVIEIEDTPPPPPVKKVKLKDDWKHIEQWVSATILHLMPPPVEASPGATMAVQRELRSMMKEQENAASLKELGWYMPQEFNEDNLFQWIVEMHSFDPSLPIAKDLKNMKINSVIFEIRFPPTFPLGPPFFRIVSPRFLPFIQGGGGHVTGGGSICMDLLTSDGWLPSYSISAVLMQIKLAISNLDPRPARLARDWDRPYGVQEALEGYKRAATTHGWQIPKGIDRLVLQV